MHEDRFVAPRRGIYLFSFSGQTTSEDEVFNRGFTRIQVRKGKSMQAYQITYLGRYPKGAKRNHLYGYFRVLVLLLPCAPISY